MTKMRHAAPGANRVDVLVVCSGLGPGGTERVVATLAGGWARQGRRVGVATLSDTPDFYALPAAVVRQRVGGGPVHRQLVRVYRWLKPLFSRVSFSLKPWARVAGPVLQAVAMATTYAVIFAEARLLRRTIRGLGAATVVSFGAQTSLISILACRGTPCRVVVSERNDVMLQRVTPPVARLRYRLYERADRVTANSLGTLAALGKWVPTEKLRFTPNPVDIPPGTRKGPPPPSLRLPSILIVARLVEQKAHDVLLDALARLPAELGHWRLAIVGAGEKESALRRQAHDLGVAPRVDWHGLTTDPYGFYRHAQIFALPSRFEGMPNALLEAMSFGMPPVVTDSSPGPLELVKHGETGLVVPADDPDALAWALTELANRPDLRSRLGDAAQREVRRFSMDAALRAWEEAIA